MRHWLTPSRWYHLENNEMTHYIQWLGRRWFERPCRNWINDMATASTNQKGTWTL